MATYTTKTTVTHPDGTIVTTTTSGGAAAAIPAGVETILVAGGAGYIGSFTVRELVKVGYKVVVLDDLRTGKAKAVDAGAVLEQVDLEDIAAVHAVFAKHKIDAVIDFVANLSVGESMENPLLYMRNNVQNFVNLLDAMTAAGVKYIVKSSTSSTYGTPADEEFPLKEDYQERYKPAESQLDEGVVNFPPGSAPGNKLGGEALFTAFIDYYKALYAARPELTLTEGELTKLRIPNSIYGLSKLINEVCMAKFAATSGLKWTALRYFNVCGACPSGGMGEDKPRPSTLMTLCIAQVLGKRDKLKVFGMDFPTKDGTGVRDYIHPMDLATAHISALRHMQSTNTCDIYNLGNGVGSTVLEVIAAVDKASGKSVAWDPAPRRSGDPPVSFCDPAKANKTFGWTAEYDIDAQATSAWAWHSGSPDGYATSK